MEVKAGYRQTEVGVIPEDWEVKALESILNRGRLGGNYPNQDIESSKPLIKMGNIARGNIDLEKVEYIPDSVSPAPEHQLHFGDVLFNTRNTLDLVGKVAIWRDELPVAYYNSNLMRLEFDPKEISSNAFANYILNSQSSIARLRSIATGTTSVAAIYTRDLLNFKFPVPDKIEQRAIATALSDVDALITSLDKLIAKKRDIKQAAMQELLTGKRRLPGFESGKGYKKTEIGLIPLDWEINAVSQFGDVKRGASSQYIKYVQQSGVRLIRINDFFEHNPVFILPTDEIMRFTINENDVLFAGTGASAGASYIPKEEWIGLPHSYNVPRIRVRKNQSKQYLLFSLQSDYVAIQQRAWFVGAAQPFLDTHAISNFKIATPKTVNEQTAIATVLSDMDTELAALEQKRDKTKAIKQGMMQELLTGRIRLV